MSTPTRLMENGGGHTAATAPRALEQSARARASLLKLLTSLFRDEPTQSVITALRSPPIREALSEAGLALEDGFFTEDIDALDEKLMVEFCSLFLVPGSLVSPHESVQTPNGSGILRGPETARVKEYYEGLGFEVDETAPIEPDHISVELEFLGHLCEQEAEAWTKDERTRAIDALRYQQDFLNRHLGKWDFIFLEKMEEQAAHPFYREIARLTRTFLDDEREKLPEQIKALET